MLAQELDRLGDIGVGADGDDIAHHDINRTHHVLLALESRATMGLKRNT